MENSIPFGVRSNNLRARDAMSFDMADNNSGTPFDFDKLRVVPVSGFDKKPIAKSNRSSNLENSLPLSSRY